MKRILAFILCFMVLCAMPVVAFAEGEEVVTEVTESSDYDPTIPEQIVGFIKDNFEGVSFSSLAVAVVGYIFYAMKSNRGMKGLMGVVNNNAVTIAKDSAKVVNEAMEKAETIVENSINSVQTILAEVASIAETVKGYKEDITYSIAEIRKSAEEKQSLEDMLLSVQKTLETLKMADLEFGNEVAELLVLANIPVSKKDELYARHRAVVDAIATADTTEVINDDGKET